MTGSYLVRHSEREWTMRRVRGFSIIEMVVVIAILAILMTMGYSALSRGKTVSKDTVCRNNLKQIALGLGLYFNAYKVYPSEDLPSSLRAYVGNSPGLFLCPADPDPQGDSYSQFYVARAGQSTQDYVCGCPRHLDEHGAVTLFSSSSAQLLEMRPVHWNGQAIPPGAGVGSGVMSFADGSRATIPSGMVVRLIQSFRMKDGRFYSLIGMDVNETGTLDVEVTPGSRFEVVTPAAIAGVQGTRFQVTTYIENDRYCVKVKVFEGEVEVKHRWRNEPAKLLRANQVREIAMPREAVFLKLAKQWEGRRVERADDVYYEKNASSDMAAPIDQPAPTPALPPASPFDGGSDPADSTTPDDGGGTSVDIDDSVAVPPADGIIVAPPDGTTAPPPDGTTAPPADDAVANPADGDGANADGGDGNADGDNANVDGDDANADGGDGVDADNNAGDDQEDLPWWRRWRWWQWWRRWWTQPY